MRISANIGSFKQMDLIRAYINARETTISSTSNTNQVLNRDLHLFLRIVAILYARKHVKTRATNSTCIANQTPIRDLHVFSRMFVISYARKHAKACANHAANHCKSRCKPLQITDLRISHDLHVICSWFALICTCFYVYLCIFMLIGHLHGQ